MSRTLLVMGGIFLILLISGCNTTGLPVVPADDHSLSPQTDIRLSQTHLWGFYDVFMEPGTNQLTLVVNRNAMFTANVVTFMNGSSSNLQLDNMEIKNAVDYIDVGVDVGLRHPFSNMHQYDGYDVRGVFIGNGSELLGYNPDLQVAQQWTDQFMFPDPDDGAGGPDGYTRWYNPSEFLVPGILGYTPGKLATPGYKASATLCPYRYFADGLGVNGDLWGYLLSNSADHGVFSSGSLNWRRYYMRFPMPSPGIKFSYAVLANWEAEDVHPSNTSESVACKVVDTSNVYYVSPSVNGGKIKLDLSLWDWDSKIDPSGAMEDYTIFIESTVLGAVHQFSTGEMTPVDGTENYSTYHVEIEADAVSSDTGNEYWVIAEEQDADYTNEFGISNHAGTDKLAACFRYDLTVSNEIPAYIEVTSPNGGEEWYVGYDEEVTWTSQGVTGTVFIEYSKDNFVADINTIATGETNDGSFMWESIPDDTSDTVRVRVSSTDNPGVNDMSDEDFSIVFPPGDLLWAKRAGGTSSEHGVGITTLSDNSTVVTGYFGGSATFGPGEPNETVLTSAGWDDIFIARYNTDGTLAWAKRAGGSNYDYGYEITTLSDNSTVVTGWFGYPAGGSATFGPGEANETVLVSAGGTDIFIAHYNTDGTLAWAKRAGGASFADGGYGITTLSDNSTVVTGFFYVSATFGPGEPNQTVLASAGGYDIFIARYNPNGTLAWAKRAGGTFYDEGNGIMTLSDNSTVVTGFFGKSGSGPTGGSATFGPGEPNETVLTSAGYGDIFVARYNPDGTLAWAKRAGGTGDDEGYEITTLSDNSTVVTGWFQGLATFGPGETNETVLTSAGSIDIFIAHYNPDGTLAWAKRAGGTGDDGGGGITTLSDNSTVVTGQFWYTATFGPGEPNQTVLTSAGWPDIFIARYNPDGTLAWAKRAGGVSGDVGYGITTLSDNSTVVTGTFFISATFGPGEPNETVLNSAGIADIFIARFLP